MSANAVEVLVLHAKDRADSAAASTAAADDWITTTPARNDSEECYLQSFHPSMVAHGLSQLGRSASGAHQAYVRLEVTNTDLTDPQPIAHCQHVQQLVLAHNCLTTLQPLSQLQHLTSLDVSHNSLEKVLDYTVAATSNTASKAQQDECTDSRRCRQGAETAGPHPSSSNLRKADLSYNSIAEVGDLSCHSNLSELNLAGNQLQRISSGLEALKRLQRLDLSSNSISTCQGLQGLRSVQQLALDGNRISNLQPLSALTGLQVLTAAHNVISHLGGVEGLTSLRRLDVSWNRLRRIEVLAACRGLTLLTSLNVSGNPLEAVQDARLHLVHLLPQLQQLNELEVPVSEKVDAGNMVGAATDGLVLIRRRFFPHGELEDGGGAVPPTAAGLKASQAEEERSCADPSAMFGVIDHWAKSIQPCLALQPAVAAAGAAARTTSLPPTAAFVGLPFARHSSAGQLQPGHLNSSSSRRGSSRSTSRPGSNEAQRVQIPSRHSTSQPGGVAAIADRLAAGCCSDAPYRQLQLLHACHCWVLHHVQLPCDCDLEAGADLVTWDVGRHLFGEQEQEQLLHEVLLPGYSGTWAECVSQLLVSLLRACQLEAVQLSGFWKAGGGNSVVPGEQLASHNHSWVAAKVNGRWRLLDPVSALVMAHQDQPLHFFLPPEALIHTHLPFQACWQLLPEPVRTQEWWQRPELSLSFAASGGQLLDSSQLRACIQLELGSDARALPIVKIPIAAPDNPQQQLCISLLDEHHQVLASWPMQANMQAANTPPQQCWEPAAACSQQDSCGQQAQQPARGCCLVFQQQVLGATGRTQLQLGPGSVPLAVQELWVAFPGPGTYNAKVEQVTEVPGGLMRTLHVEGLQKPLSLTLRQRQTVLRIKVVVQQAASPSVENTAGDACIAATVSHDSSAVASRRADDRPPLIGCLPELMAPSAPDTATGWPKQPTLQLLAPPPGTVLEADRTEQFEVVAPAAAAVAVGSQQSGWVVLQRHDDTGSTGSVVSEGMAVYHGSVVLPRVSTAYIAVQDQQQQQQQCNGSQHSTDSTVMWLPVLGLHVWPPVQDLVLLPEPQVPAAQEPASGHGYSV